MRTIPDDQVHLRAAFRGTAEELRRTHEIHDAERRTLQAEHDAAFWAEYRKVKPSARKQPAQAKLREVLGEERWAAVRAPFQARADVIMAEQDRVLKALKDRLWDLAQAVDVRPGETFRLFKSVGSWAYNTQGFGAMKYAKGAAESDADAARACGIEVDVRSVLKRYDSWGCPVGRVDVFVKTNDVDVLRHKPGPDLIEQVRLAWKRGVNPRVDMPFLPYGFEEKHNLDYYGGYMKGATA